MRSRGDQPAYFVSFVMLAPQAAGLDPSAIVVWGDPDVVSSQGSYESIGLITLSSAMPSSGDGSEMADAHYFGRLPEKLARQLRIDELTGTVPHSRTIADALTLLVDEDAYKDAYEEFGGARQGTYFEDQTIAPGDGAAKNHGVAQIISYFAGIGSRLGQSVPDTLHLASTAGDAPPSLAATFSPGVYLRNMIATSVAQRDIFATNGSWSGQTFGKWPNGFGRFSYLSGATYSGEMHRGQRRGGGTWQGSDGLTIIGTFDGDQPVEALVIFPDGDTFSGTLKNGRLDHGDYHWKDGANYVGSFGSTEQLADGTLTTAAGDSIGVVHGLPQPDGPSPVSPVLPQSNRLLAYFIDFSR